VAINMESVLAFEVTRKRKKFPDERLGYVIRAEQAGVIMWIAFAILTVAGDSFVGTFETPRKAREAIVEQEKKLRRSHGASR